MLEMLGPGPDFRWVLELPAGLWQVGSTALPATTGCQCIHFPHEAVWNKRAVFSSLCTCNALLSTIANGQVAIQTGVFELIELIVKE